MSSLEQEPYRQWLARVQLLPEPSRSEMIQWASTHATRLRSIRDYPSPALLASSIEPGYVVTPAIKMLGEALEETLNERRGRLLITMPPQEGKTELTGVWTVLRALQQDPDRRVILASYSSDLAEESSQRARNIIQAHGSEAKDTMTGREAPDKLGIALAADRARSANWRLKGFRGGMVSVGFGGTITGRPADCLIIDDPLKGMQQSDSATERRRVIQSFQGDLTTRLSPEAPIILIQTRWHPDDLAGWILKRENELPEDERRWKHINIPAQAEKGVKDDLGREPGEFLVSSRGRTRADWEETKKAVGERVWYALYQGVPTPTAGGLFQHSWISRYRVEKEPEDVAVRIVSVDPAETGKGDEAGIIALTADSDSVAYVTEDWSGLMQSHEWARAAVLLTLKTHASELLFEAFTTGPTYERVLEDAWKRIRQEQQLINEHDGDVAAAAREYALLEYSPADTLAALQELDGITVPDRPDMPFVIRPWRAPGDKVARSVGSRQAMSTGRLRMVGHHVKLEEQAVTWQPGMSSPDRVDSLVNGYERLMQMMGSPATIASPVSSGATRPAGGGFWSARME